tara:strand:+ start:10488 stop:11936 length:1449 start_codon:yes stop_codon:yes gene_type:complete
MKSKKIIPVILCGGSGTRLWPLSRRSFPKQFLTLNFTNDYSLLQRTHQRIRKIENIQDPILICNEEHRFIVAEQMRRLQVKPSSIILEPFGRNTAPAIAIAAIKALEIHEDPNLLILSSDHQIDNEEEFSIVIEKALEYSENNSLVTFGIVPTSPEVGYGYIKSKDMLDEKQIKGSKIDSFIEKPNKSKAESFIKDNRFTWNSGIFMFKASLILDELNKYSKDLVKNCYASLEKKLFDLDFQRLDRDSFSDCPNVSIDIAVMEKTKNAYVLPLNAGWSDVGSWDYVWKISKKDSAGNVIQGNVIEKNNKNSYISSNNRLIAAIGLTNIVVIETRDAILISNKEQSQEVKNIVKIMKEKNISQSVEHQKCYRPWGTYESLIKDNKWQVKLIEVKPGEKLSLQKHQFRSEHWVVVNGVAKVEIDGEKFILNENESSYIPRGSKHRLYNPGEEILKIIEIQTGTYLGEDDIERFDDNYGRIGFNK